MSDRLNNKSRADLGWDKMAGILDKEMPVKEDKRRPVFLWWLSGISVIIVLVTASWFLLPANETIPVQPLNSTISEQIVADSEQSKENSIAQSTEIQTNTSNKINSAPTKMDARSTTETVKSDGKLSRQPNHFVKEEKQKSVLFQSAKWIGSETQNKNRTMVSQQESVAVPTQHEYSDDKQSDTKIVSPAATISSSKRSSLEYADKQIEFLYTGSIDHLNTDKLEILEVPLPDVIGLEMKQRNRLEFGLELGVLSQNMYSFGGYTVGATVSYPFNSKWSLTSGLAFQNHKFSKQKEQVDQAANLRPDEILFTTDPGIPSSITTFPGTTNSFDLQTVGDIVLDNQIRSLEYLTIPVRVDYRANRRLGFFAGASVSYLLGATFYDGYAVSSDDTETNEYDILRIQPDKTTLGVWDVQALTGMGFHISRRISFELSYNFGFIPIVKQREVNLVIQETNKVFSVPELNQNKYNRYFSLKVRYGF